MSTRTIDEIAVFSMQQRTLRMLTLAGLSLENVHAFDRQNIPCTYLDADLPLTYRIETYLPIRTNFQLFCLAHECGHVVHGHMETLGRHMFEMEFEASKWALEHMYVDWEYQASDYLGAIILRSIFAHLDTEIDDMMQSKIWPDIIAWVRHFKYRERVILERITR